jgi:methylglutaconyl-CoA hydratase
MGFKYLTVTREHGVEYLTLNRPAVRNAFNEAAILELTWWADSVARDETIRAVVLRGEGPVFCAGADLDWMKRVASFTREQNLHDASEMSRLFQTLDRLPVPVIGRVHGAALGGGAGLVAVCDIAVASDDAAFGFTEVRLGLIPGVIAPFVIAKIGRSAARELFLSGVRFGAERAQRLGLVHQVVPAATLDEAVEATVGHVLAAPRGALAAAKQLIAEVSRRGSADVSGLCAEAIAFRRVSDEGQEGIRAFLEKRQPRWSVPASKSTADA